MKTIDPLFESVETFFVDYMKLLEERARER